MQVSKAKFSIGVALGAASILALTTSARSLTAPAAAPTGEEIPLKVSQIYWEYNSTDDDLGVHVRLDGEDWRKMKIYNPKGKKLFDVKGTGPYQDLGMTELFFEGAEPTLDEVPLEVLLALFPEGEYEFEGRDVDNQELEGEWMFSHAIPDGPNVSTQQGANNFLQVNWTKVTAPPPGFPNRPILITGYQVIVGSFQVTLPASATSVTVPSEFVAALKPGAHEYEVLAIDQSGNQTLRAGTFVK